jgi:hypothetical protein
MIRDRQEKPMQALSINGKRIRSLPIANQLQS